MHQSIEFSVVIPCLNEARTLGRCIRAAQDALHTHGIRGEVIVADNGSTDGSQEIARGLGARVVPVATKGYGSALDGGIRAARGRYILMADGDDSYDFGELDRFLTPLRDGNDLVMGNRFRGEIQPGAMPWKNRYFGNPVLSRLGRLLFATPCGDFHCGIRAFSKDAYERMNLRMPGMEFASEMVMQASLQGMRIAEVPATLRKDGRGRPPHLRPWRDGWRHLRLMLLHAPRWLFVYPGLLCLAVALVLLGAGFTAPVSAGLVVAGFGLAVLGTQALGLSVLARQLAVREGLLPPSRLSPGRFFNFEMGAVIGAPAMALGGASFVGLALAGLVATPWAALSAGMSILGTQFACLCCVSSLMALPKQKEAQKVAESARKAA